MNVKFPPHVVDAIADRVAELVLGRLRPLPGDLVDAKHLADVLNVNRTWVYEHAEELGAQRLLDGPKAPLRFDLHKTLELIAARSARPTDASPAQSPPASRRRRAPSSDRDLLPIRGDRG